MKKTLILLLLPFLVGCTTPTPSATPQATAAVATPNAVPATATPQASESVDPNSAHWGLNAFDHEVLTYSVGDYEATLELDGENFDLTLKHWIESGGGRMASGIPFRSAQPLNVEKELQKTLSDTPDFREPLQKVLEAYLAGVDGKPKPGAAQAEIAEQMLAASKR